MVYLNGIQIYNKEMIIAGVKQIAASLNNYPAIRVILK